MTKTKHLLLRAQTAVWGMSRSCGNNRHPASLLWQFVFTRVAVVLPVTLQLEVFVPHAQLLAAGDPHAQPLQHQQTLTGTRTYITAEKKLNAINQWRPQLTQSHDFERRQFPFDFHNHNRTSTVKQLISMLRISWKQNESFGYNGLCTGEYATRAPVKLFSHLYITYFAIQKAQHPNLGDTGWI